MELEYSYRIGIKNDLLRHGVDDVANRKSQMRDGMKRDAYRGVDNGIDTSGIYFRPD